MIIAELLDESIVTLKCFTKSQRAITQFDSIRKIRSAYLVSHEAGPIRCLENGCFKSDKGQMFSLLDSPTQSRLFTMFMQGCERRMGRFVKQDMGLSLPMLMEILTLYEIELNRAEVDSTRKREVIIFAGTFVILFAGALRGGEVLMLEVSEFVKRREDGRRLKDNGHVVVPLMGRFKNETGERNLVIVLANETKGGLHVRKWVDRFTALLMMEEKHLITGPAVCDQEGFAYSGWTLTNELRDMLKQVRSTTTEIIPSGLEIDKCFSAYRSFRRGATTRAKEQGVSEPTIHMNNRWRTVQNKQGSLPKLPMTQLYVELTQALTSKLRFSKSL